MNFRYLLGIGMLFSIAVIWGFTFAFQREGMEFIGPYTFNTIRFFIGALSVLPVIWIFPRKKTAEGSPKTVIGAGIVTGAVLFVGINLQQVGMIETTAGKAAFITGLYILAVPIMGIFLGQKIGAKVWFAGVLAVVGLYFLSVTDGFRLAPGDGLVFASVLFWGGQVVLVGIFSPKVHGPTFAFLQFATVSVLSAPLAFYYEGFNIDGIDGAITGLLFAGIAATGIAITFQVLAQAWVPSVQAAMIMSMETVFGAIGGWLLLGEVLTQRMLVGAGLMLCGIIIAQLPGRRRQKPIRWAFRRTTKKASK
ncbi:DMT family transporter [Cochlodiniinecator piscidefendens]|uniref:DMT family transporter n=1 Tax=Cochlodiniinecator piscidefendens TaxID=2715756 RepID=UPI00140DB137|nr:DMT family transporter [Cochlodiniinecator piscidefendens]